MTWTVSFLGDRARRSLLMKKLLADEGFQVTYVSPIRREMTCWSIPDQDALLPLPRFAELVPVGAFSSEAGHPADTDGAPGRTISIPSSIGGWNTQSRQHPR